MRPAGRLTTARFLALRLARKAELVWWYFLAWTLEQHDRWRDKQSAERLAADPLRYGRRPYERNADVLQDREW